jgi:hypothetical protein
MSPATPWVGWRVAWSPAWCRSLGLGGWGCSLGAIGAAVGVGNFLGTAAGARLKLGHPEVIVVICASTSAAACVVTAAFFGLPMAVACMAVCSACNSLGKLALDAVIQRDVSEMLRSSAFARSETFLQLAWVVGAAIAILLPSQRGTLGMSIAAGFLAVCAVFIVLRSRAMAAARRSAPGTV